ncbi:MAG TPA: site-2 protease family protein [Pyrinomonadaceae bacterium]|jgi:Zn-dependent protease|nr:site-2 protease family protein [Pyrinomonadaceae bacterium]
MGNIDGTAIGQFLLSMVALIFSLSVHESAHAWMSNRFGDDLARLQGRITLNPVAHVDPIGTLLLPAIAFFTHIPVIGWAKPTPVNPLRWRNKRVANFWVSAAGVICNFIMAIIAGIVMRLLFEANLVELATDGYRIVVIPHSTSLVAEGAGLLLSIFFTLNFALGIFNLIPIPPLDGSKVLQSILPPEFESGFDALERFGYLLLMVAMFTGIFGVIFRIFMPLGVKLVLIGT